VAIFQSLWGGLGATVAIFGPIFLVSSAVGKEVKENELDQLDGIQYPSETSKKIIRLFIYVMGVGLSVLMIITMIIIWKFVKEKKTNPTKDGRILQISKIRYLKQYKDLLKYKNFLYYEGLFF
jgi:hypothetical protein